MYELSLKPQKTKKKKEKKTMEKSIYTIQQHWQDDNVFYFVTTDTDKLIEEIEQIIERIASGDCPSKIISFKVDTVFPEDDEYEIVKKELENLDI